MAHIDSDLHQASAVLPRQARTCTIEERGLAAHGTEIAPVTPAISHRAAALTDELALSQGLRLADALIGATAIELQAPLRTANVRHFSAIEEGLVVEASLP